MLPSLHVKALVTSLKTFSCHCGNALHFENSRCMVCGRLVGFLPDAMRMAGLDPAGDELWHRPERGAFYRRCRNYRDYDSCNWMVPVGEADDYCASCRLNLIVPNLGVPRNLVLWYRIESAKRRLLYTLFRLRLPIVDRRQDAEGGLGFEFLDAGIDHPAPASHRPPPSNVVTGHRAGIITLDISEAEDSAREHMREQMNERYRTLLGHFRHEIGHYYWDRLVAGGELLAEFRRLFGDERGDYAQALASYYRDGPRAGWESSWISAYASAHPWEDWAETWAHYLHMIDTLETAHDYGFSIGGRDLAGSPHLRRALSDDDAAVSCDLLIADWVTLSVALNALNRSMGLPDAYPFALGGAALEKLAFVHTLVQSVAAGGAETEPRPAHSMAESYDF